MSTFIDTKSSVQRQYNKYSSRNQDIEIVSITGIQIILWAILLLAQRGKFKVKTMSQHLQTTLWTFLLDTTTKLII